VTFYQYFFTFSGNPMTRLSLFLIVLLLSCSKATEPEPQKQTPEAELCAIMPAGSAGTIRISGLIPNPDGTDDRAEVFFVKNYSAKETISLVGWSIRDEESNGTVEWKLDALGTLAPCEEKMLVSDKSAQLLNSGDTVMLYNGATLIQTIGYGSNVGSGDTVRAK
jgi:hypothetical protein